MTMEKPATQRPNILLRAGAIAGALSAILGLLFLFFPRLKPTVTETPKTRAVILSNLQVNFREYGDSAVWIVFKAQIDGYQGITLSVMWTLYDAGTGHEFDTWPLLQVPLGPHTTRHEGWPRAKFTPTVQSESFSGEIRIPGRPLVNTVIGRTWRVKLEVIDPAGAQLTYAETEPFSVPESFSARP